MSVDAPRTASAMLREILGDAHKVIRPQSPRVILSVELQHTYNRELEGRLDFQERDDQLIGTVYEFARTNSSADVRLLTHDTIPLYTARGLGVQADIILDDWLLQPEKTESERRLTALEAENARLKSAEPSVSLRCADPSDTEINRYSRPSPGSNPHRRRARWSDAAPESPVPTCNPFRFKRTGRAATAGDGC